MGRASARAVMNGQVSEKEFQAAVIRYAELRGYRVYHTHDSRRSAAGFPDLVLVKHGRLVFAELKTEKGRLSKAQEEWLDALGNVGDPLCDHCADVHVWRPSNWPVIEAVLA